jgi:uncharacterized protein YdaU (DUF1376 family)
VMNFYRRFIGDYMRDTQELTLIEHGAYTLLLDHHYATEEALTLEKSRLYRITRAGTASERAAVDRVLARFFEKSRVGYVQKRAVEEIEYARSRADVSRNNGKLGGRPKEVKNPLGFPAKPCGNPAGFPTKSDKNQEETRV